jgi:hypothetical protein
MINVKGDVFNYQQVRSAQNWVISYEQRLPDLLRIAAEALNFDAYFQRVICTESLKRAVQNYCNHSASNTV